MNVRTWIGILAATWALTACDDGGSTEPDTPTTADVDTSIGDAISADDQSTATAEGDGTATATDANTQDDVAADDTGSPPVGSGGCGVGIAVASETWNDFSVEVGGK